MIRIAALASLALALTASAAPAQVIYVVESRPRVVYSSPVYAPVVTYASPVVYSTPVVTYSSPVVYSAPVTTYSYYPSTTVYSSPAVSYSYYPATTVYSAPVAVPGVVTTRSYIGYGIFRPRGVYTQTYVSPY